MKITFKASDDYICMYSYKNGRKTFNCIVSDGVVSCHVYYDFKELPLLLQCGVHEDDTVEIILMPHRIELWSNSVLKDEEWPAGKRLFNADDTLTANTEVSVLPYASISDVMPSILGSFENAEGWRPGKNIFVGDCMPYTCDNRYHVLYLKDRHHHSSKWGYGAHQWEHISTADLKTWDIHPTAIAITDPSEGSICTGSWIKNDDTHYLFYTVRMADNSPAPILRSISKDGCHFEKDNTFSVILSEKYHRESARDPKVILGSDGLYHMFLTTSLQKEQKGCLAHLVSKDLSVWQELENPIYISETSDQPECPDYIEYNGYYYLIFSLKGKAHYMFSKNPFNGWIMPENPIIPCSSVPKGAVWDGKIIFTGFKALGPYAGNMTFKKAHNSNDGILVFE